MEMSRLQRNPMWLLGLLTFGIGFIQPDIAHAAALVAPVSHPLLNSYTNDILAKPLVANCIKYALRDGTTSADTFEGKLVAAAAKMGIDEGASCLGIPEDMALTAEQDFIKSLGEEIVDAGSSWALRDQNFVDAMLGSRKGLFMDGSTGRLAIEYFANKGAEAKWFTENEAKNIKNLTVLLNEGGPKKALSKFLAYSAIDRIVAKKVRKLELKERKKRAKNLVAVFRVIGDELLKIAAGN